MTARRTVPSALALFFALSCGVDHNKTDQVSAPTGDAGTVCSVPPRPAEIATNPTQFTFAVDSWDFGEPRAEGERERPRYLGIGRDIDGMSMPSCTTRSGPVALAQLTGAPGLVVNADGACGTDNGFALLASARPPTYASDTDTVLAKSGSWTLLIRLDDVGTGPSQGHFAGAVLHAAPRSPPSFSATEEWSPTLDSFAAGTPLAILEGYVTDNLIVSTKPFSVDFCDTAIVYLGVRVPVSRALIAAKLSTDRTQLEGTLSGVISGADLDHRVDVAGGGEFSTVPIEWYVGDALLSGEVNPSKECDAISFGVHFTAKRVSLGAPAAPIVPAPGPCAK